MRDIGGRWMGQIVIGGSLLRVWFKEWAWPYRRTEYGVTTFGIGPLGFNWWPRGTWWNPATPVKPKEDA